MSPWFVCIIFIHMVKNLLMFKRCTIIWYAGPQQKLRPWRIPSFRNIFTWAHSGKYIHSGTYFTCALFFVCIMNTAFILLLLVLLYNIFLILHLIICMLLLGIRSMLLFFSIFLVLLYFCCCHISALCLRWRINTIIMSDFLHNRTVHTLTFHWHHLQETSMWRHIEVPLTYLLSKYKGRQCDVTLTCLVTP